MKKLKISGQISHENAIGNDAEDRIVRPAILVHGGPGGSEAIFYTGDDPGPDPEDPQNVIKFDGARIKRVVENQNAMMNKLAEQYGGWDKMPMGAFPPLLDQHSDDSNDRIRGRLASPVRFEIRDVPKVGKDVPCVVTDITFLGNDNVKRVKDGRIYHLSIGIDENTDTLGECSAVIEPAAPGAMLLNKGKQGAGRKLKKEKTMSKANMQEQVERRAKKLSLLQGITKDLTKLSTELKGSADLVKLTKRQGQITHRLTGLMKAGRLTPAEYKKLDVKKLSKLPDDALNTVLESYDVREPVIDPHQKGSRDGMDFATIGKSMAKKQLKALEKETVSDLMRVSGGQVKLKAGSRLAGEGKDEDKDHGYDHEMSGPKESEVKPGHDEHAVPDSEKLSAFKKHMSECKKHMDAGDFDKAKEEHEKAMAHMSSDDKHMSFGVGDVKSEDYKKGMDALEAKVDELATNLARMAGAVGELMDVEKEEGHDLAAEGEDDKEHEEVEE